MSTRRTRGTDRVVTVVVGAVLIAAGLAAWDWRLSLTGGLASTLDVSAAEPVLDSAWWPWAWAVAGIALGLVGLRWLLSHRPRLTRGTSRLAESDPTGRLEVDRSSLASTLAQRWGDLAPVTGARGRALPDAPEVVELSAHVEVEADAEALVQAAEASRTMRSACASRSTARPGSAAPRRTTDIAVEA